MKGDISRGTRWLAVNGIMAAGLWYGLVEGKTGPQNVGLFMAWLQIVVLTCVWLNRSLAISYRSRRFPPWWIEDPFRLAILGLLAWHACWITAGAWAVTSVAASIMSSAPRSSGEIVDV